MADFFLVLDEVTKQPSCIVPVFENTVTDLGSTVDTTDPQNPVVTVTSSDGADTSFTIAIPAGSTSSITNLSHTVAGTDLTIESSDGADTTVDMEAVFNNFFAALPVCA